MLKLKFFNLDKKSQLFLIPSLIALISPILFVLVYSFLFWGKVYPGVYIAGVNVGGKTKEEALLILQQKTPIPKTLSLTHQGQVFALDLTPVEFSYNLESSVDSAFSLYRTGNFFYDIPSSVLSIFRKPKIDLSYNLNESKLTKSLETIALQVGTPPVYPSVQLKGTEVIINKGQKGKEMDTKSLITTIKQGLASGDYTSVEIKLMANDPSLSDEETRLYKNRVGKILGKKITLSFEFQNFVYEASDLSQLIDPKGNFKRDVIENLVTNIATKVDRDPQNPVFIFSEGKVQEFKPSKDGVAVDKTRLQEMITSELKILEEGEDKSTHIDIPVVNTPAKIQTADVNNLGIKELLGRGASRFAHSTASRIHNIGLAASKFNGVLLAPGETFSFNQVLGDVSAYTGYQQAYVIKDGATVLGDGGGVCQVSTTLFRAILNAGLPVVERRAHSYRVGYYEQDSSPGIDATVYAPSPDLKFLNDTPAYLLIQTAFDPKNYSLIFEVYGTSDKRVASITKPVITSSTPPPEDKYIDDPTLPAGTVKQIDFAAWGAKVNFTYTVKRDGKTLINKTFYSNYQPWQGVYLRGTAPPN